MDPRQTIPKKIRYFLEYLLFLVMYSFIKNRTASGISKLGNRIGTLIYRLSAKRRKIARTNLDIAFGDTKSISEKNRITKQSMIQVATSARALSSVDIGLMIDGGLSFREGQRQRAIPGRMDRPAARSTRRLRACGRRKRFPGRAA